MTTLQVNTFIWTGFPGEFGLPAMRIRVSVEQTDESLMKHTFCPHTNLKKYPNTTIAFGISMLPEKRCILACLNCVYDGWVDQYLTSYAIAMFEVLAFREEILI